VRLCANPSDQNFATFVRNRPIYPVVLIDAIVLKARGGQVANRPICVAMRINLNGFRDVRECGSGDGRGGREVLDGGVPSDLRNRGVKDTFFVVCDGLKGLPNVITATWARRDRGDLINRHWSVAGWSRRSQHHTRRRPMQTRAFEASCRPVPPGGGGSRGGQRELRFERRDEVPARPAVP
jgi:hypothetical protein